MLKTVIFSYLTHAGTYSGAPSVMSHPLRITSVSSPAREGFDRAPSLGDTVT